MKRYFLFVVLSLCPLLATGQANGEQSREKNYKLSGTRHGVSYFPKVRYSQVQYEPGDTLAFDRYHSYDVITAWLKKWAEQYPDLIDLYVQGESFEGRPVFQVTLTNKKIGKDTDKPAAYFEGGRHSGEITASESALWLLKYMLNNYGKDPDVTHIVDTKALYFKPVNNPDGHSLYVNTAQSNRSTVRPHDSDGDGMLDEDAAEDLDSNGLILDMRWKDDKKGSFILDPRDPTGRIMKKVDPGKGQYLLASEGYDNDADGKINEDGIGGLDLHRNYPENWRPESEATGRGYVQGGAGEYPLSENETMAVVRFLLSHPNVYVVNSMDTSIPMHLRPPSTSGSDERMYPEDLEWYKIFDEIGKKITGYKKAGDVYNDYGEGQPLFGHGPDFGYFYFGSIWYGDEIWNTAKNRDYDGNDTIDDIEILRWDDEENGGEGFFEWHTVKHPLYGEVETGGFNPKFFLQNPPARYLETWIKNEAMFNLEMLKYLPELKWDGVNVRKLRTYKDSADYQVSVSFRNTGKLPTALKQAQLVKIVTPDRVVLDMDTTGISQGKLMYRLLPGKSDDKKKSSSPKDKFVMSKIQVKGPLSVNVPYTQGGSVTTAIFNIRLFSREEMKAKAAVFSTRGGILKDLDVLIR